MADYRVTRRIAADPDRIWSILTDHARLSDGTFGIRRIDGSIEEGQTIRLWSDVDPKRAFSILIAEVEAPRRMLWQSGLPLGLFTGKRLFDLTPSGAGTVFKMEEAYHGPMAGVVARMIPDLQPSFERFADGLAAAAEGET